MMSKDPQGEESHPGWSMIGSDKESDGNIGHGGMEKSSMEIDYRATDGATLPVFEPEINIWEERKNNPRKNPFGSDDFFEEESDEKGPQDAKFDIEKHQFRE